MPNKLILKYVSLVSINMCEGITDLASFDFIDQFIVKGLTKPLIFDHNLNGGVGGIISGRKLLSAINAMYIKAPAAAPIGVAYYMNTWAIPVLFSLDPKSAERMDLFAIKDESALSGNFGKYDDEWMWGGGNEDQLANLKETTPHQQASFFDMLGDPSSVEPDFSAEWLGMPEFVSKDLSPFKTINVSFANLADYKAFQKLVDQRLTLKTKTIWYPTASTIDMSSKIFVSKEDAEKYSLEDLDDKS